MSVAKLTLNVFCSIVLFQYAFAQEFEPEVMAGPELSIGEIDFSSFRWGRQTAIFEVTNNTGELKFITVETKVQFSGTYLNPIRQTQSHYILEPLEARIFRPSVSIPGNFGSAQITISLYDVVDTLDITLPTQKFFEQPFTIVFHIPDELFTYLNEKVDLPPMVERHPDFDNEFARILPVLLNEGKSVEDIAAMSKADTSFVQDAVQAMVEKGYVKKENGSYHLNFPIISVAEAEEAKKLAIKLSDNLAAKITNNMDDYSRILDSLISVGALDADSNVFFDGGGVLHRPYPVVSALLLWYDLGRKFITRSKPLTIYDGTDPCNAYIPSYMYAVQGGGTFNGTQFFMLALSRAGYQIVYGDQIPVFDCGEDFFLQAKHRRQISWGFTKEYRPENFMLDTAVVSPMLKALSAGTDSFLADTYRRLEDVAAKYGHETLSYGERYWFWNLTATHTLKKLVNRGVITRRGKGQFKFDGIIPKER